MQINITNKDISWAERILLPTGEHFDEKQKAVIRCFETKDILACPGSGKTTALLAKLLIFSQHMPLKNNRGICVLTHTNVAIDEIKSLADFASEKLFNYPNHFGTIQSFVDKYLAIPAYIQRFHKRPFCIDNEFFNSVIGRSYNTLHAAGIWLDNRREGGLEYLRELRFNKDNFCISPKPNGQAFININTKTYKEINSLKLRILDWGYLCYDDAYSLAFEYLRGHPQIRELISKRFAYVFIDEMQDTSTTQSELFNNIFNEDVIIQKIGDLNQSIFDYNTDLECGWTVNDDRTMFITGSKRFSSSIASKVEDLCVCRQSITGVGRQNEIIPIIIVYNNNTIQQVLNQFGEIIIKNNLHQYENSIFKAVGWRGKPHDREKRTIPSYWDGYSKEIKVKRTEFSNLRSYLAPQPDSLIISKGMNFYKERLVCAFLNCLRIAKITNNDRPFTDKKLHRYILEKDPNFYKDFRTRLATWCLQIHKQKEVFEEINNFLTNEFRNFFNYQVNGELTDFINSSDLEVDKEEALQNNNIYKYSSGTIEIEIEVSTIHGVKGETHTATCYLETFFRDYDIKRIMDYMKGQYTVPTKKTVIQNLKMAFVGMSRPSHLLCVAVHSDNIFGQEEALHRSGWDVNNDLCTSNND
ncbi:UvrD-helicase domain-containing protein [bacterium]|nr:UvrD-helicase domain-containing protein [bacterium]MBU4509686.1 UvrD-helicase domain-containing protein [bacterium]